MSIVPLAKNASRNVDTIYDITFYIGENDYSKAVFKVQLGASIDMIFGMVTIGFLQSPRDAIKEKIFGQENIVLTITQTTHEREPIEEIILNLMILKVIWPDIHPDNEEYLSDEYQKYNPKKIFLVCVPKSSYVAQYTMINKLFQAGSGLRPIDAVKNISEKLLVNKVISDVNANSDIIPQMIIPPTSFINAYRYIDSKYPIYDGKPALCFVQLYKDTLTIWDLRSRMSDKADYSVRFLTIGSKNKDDINKAPLDKSTNTVTYYTTGPIIRKFRGNEKIVSTFSKNSFITKPKNKRSNFIEKNIKEIFDKDSLTIYGSSTNINNILLNTQRMHPDIISSDYSDVLPRYMLSGDVSDVSDISFRMSGPNFPFLRLTEVGGGIDILSNDSIYQSYLGRYLVKKTVLSFERHENSVYYDLKIALNCVRGYYGNK